MKAGPLITVPGQEEYMGCTPRSWTWTPHLWEFFLSIFRIPRTETPKEPSTVNCDIVLRGGCLNSHRCLSALRVSCLLVRSFVYVLPKQAQSGHLFEFVLGGHGGSVSAPQTSRHLALLYVEYFLILYGFSPSCKPLQRHEPSISGCVEGG